MNAQDGGRMYFLRHGRLSLYEVLADMCVQTAAKKKTVSFTRTGTPSPYIRTTRVPMRLEGRWSIKRLLPGALPVVFRMFHVPNIHTPRFYWITLYRPTYQIVNVIKYVMALSRICDW